MPFYHTRFRAAFGGFLLALRVQGGIQFSYYWLTPIRQTSVRWTPVGQTSVGWTSVGWTSVGWTFLTDLKKPVYIKFFFVPAPITLEIIFKPSLYHGESVDISRFEIGPKMWTGRSIRHTHRQTSGFIIWIQKTTFKSVFCIEKKTLIKKT